MEKPGNPPTAFNTRQQIADDLGMSYSTLWRKLKILSIKIPSGLVSLKNQKKIYRALGYPPGMSSQDFPL